MKILHTADWHLGLPRSPYENNMNIRLQDTLNCLEEMLQGKKNRIFPLYAEIFLIHPKLGRQGGIGKCSKRGVLSEN